MRTSDWLVSHGAVVEPAAQRGAIEANVRGSQSFDRRVEHRDVGDERHAEESSPPGPNALPGADDDASAIDQVLRPLLASRIQAGTGSQTNIVARGGWAVHPSERKPRTTASRRARDTR